MGVQRDDPGRAVDRALNPGLDPALDQGCGPGLDQTRSSLRFQNGSGDGKEESFTSDLPMIAPSPNNPLHANILVTGLPRSGTTMTCWLLNQLNNVVALHEPLRLSDYPDSRPLPSILRQFIQETRDQLCREGTAPSHAMQGKIESNPISSGSGTNQLRSVIHNHQLVDFGKRDGSEFQLALKHNAPFTALIDTLSTEYPVAVIIRNPLALLCSWQTVPLPIRDGRLPMAERYDAQLRDKLSTLKEPLQRQIAILDWCFQKYHNTSASHIFKYEELIATGGRQLASLFPGARELKVDLSSRNRNSLYPLHRSTALAHELIQGSDAWRKFYTEIEILDLASQLPV